MAMNEEIIFKAEYKLPKIEEIPKTIMRSDYHIIGPVGQNTELLLRCVRSVYDERTVYLYLDPHPLIREVKLQWTLGQSTTDITYAWTAIRTSKITIPTNCHLENSKLSLEVRFRPNATIAEKTDVEVKDKLSKDFKSLFETEKHADICFDVGGEKIRAHKGILATRSEYFNCMFSSEMEECRTNIVKIDKCEASTFKTTLSLLYSGCGSNLRLGQALKILPVADRFQFTDLFKQCSEVVKRVTLASNVVQVLAVVVELNNDELRKVSFDVLKNMKEKDRWEILYNLGDDDLVKNFLHYLSE